MKALVYQPTNSNNLGMLIRSAVGFNISTLYFFDSKQLLTKKLKQIKNTSQGTYDKIEIIIIADLIKFLKEFKGRKIATTCGNEGTSLNKFIPKKTDLVIFGNERGLPKEIISLCDEKINIPLNNKLNSLNLACAFSIIAYKYSN